MFFEVHEYLISSKEAICILISICIRLNRRVGSRLIQNMKRKDRKSISRKRGFTKPWVLKKRISAAKSAENVAFGPKQPPRNYFRRSEPGPAAADPAPASDPDPGPAAGPDRRRLRTEPGPDPASSPAPAGPRRAPPGPARRRTRPRRPTRPRPRRAPPGPGGAAWAPKIDPILTLFSHMAKKVPL